MRNVLIFLVFLLGACKQNGTDLTVDHNGQINIIKDTIGSIIFSIKDTTSRLYISYHECTECLDAYVDSGEVYISESIRIKIENIEKTLGSDHVPSNRDLYLTGPPGIKEGLFGDSLNYGEHWQDKFIITGKAVDIKGLGILFKVDTYENISK